MQRGAGVRTLTRSSAAVLAAALLFSAGVLAARRDAGAEISVSRGEGAFSAAAEPEAGSGLVDINSAGAEELELLPGIGPAKAAAIMEYRAEHGPFSDVQELLEVPGIGEATFAGLRDYVRVGAQEEDP